MGTKVTGWDLSLEMRFGVSRFRGLFTMRRHMVGHRSGDGEDGEWKELLVRLSSPVVWLQ